MSQLLFALASGLFLAGACISFSGLARTRTRQLVAAAAGESLVGQALDEAGGMDRLGGLLVESRPGRTALIDHVVRGRARLVVVETKNWTGTLECGRGDQPWRQTRRSGEVRVHRSPILQAKRQARVLSEFTGVPVASLVVMAGRTVPADGSYPKGVVIPSDLPHVLPVLMHGAHKSGSAEAGALVSAWEKLVVIDSAPGAERKASRHAERTAARYGKREWVGWTAMAIATAAVATLSVLR